MDWPVCNSIPEVERLAEPVPYLQGVVSAGDRGKVRAGSISSPTPNNHMIMLPGDIVVWQAGDKIFATEEDATEYCLNNIMAGNTIYPVSKDLE